LHLRTPNLNRYSSANVIPLNALLTSVSNCGVLATPFGTIRFGRAWWFCGKYGLVGFELYMVGASVWALTKGSSSIPLWFECVAHMACWTVAVTAFVTFYLLCARINNSGYNADTQLRATTGSIDHGSPDDDRDDDLTTAEMDRFDAGRQEYDSLVRKMLVAWNVMVGVAMSLWVVLRLAYKWAQSKLQADVHIVEQTQRDDVWASTRRSAWDAQRLLLVARGKAFADVAKPLEPYIGVFVLFSVPALVMSTEYCQTRSGADPNFYLSSSRVDHAFTFGTCDVWCEFVLAFRSLATVAVYLISRERRVELVSIRVTLRKLRTRLWGCFNFAQSDDSRRSVGAHRHRHHHRRRRHHHHAEEYDLIELDDCNGDDAWASLSSVDVDDSSRIDATNVVLTRMIGSGGYVAPTPFVNSDVIVNILLLVAAPADFSRANATHAAN
jgi:hypothetical protein